ncbi:DUF3152 domain-containing protein [Nocardioides sp. SOB77]|uniref:DUF3152 domain-containing protein n=1 Tax=Nocardioides oceani TaxID=3058369 RepID=A0ABT8FM94_9ACTN|nr:DUF3152 domain-containing protein [Nocardioides oceani]MDN4175791.1 DUF3152 domain-containing protein [Nocardioides oceani]
MPEQGPGTFTTVAMEDRGGVVGGRSRTLYRVEVEDRLPLSKNVFARIVDATLADARGWGGGNQYRLDRTSGVAAIRVVLATPATTDLLCAPLATNGRVSCRNGSDVVINAWRWVHGAPSYRGDLANYRRYVINHEVGHALGRPHQTCPRPGAATPVMLQQTLGLQGCRRNPWPVNVDLIND